MGVQGALLSSLLEEPLYISSITVALSHELVRTAVGPAKAALWRAVAGTHLLGFPCYLSNSPTTACGPLDVVL